MRWGLVAMLLVGCNSGQGVDIEVHSDLGPERPLTAVELWLGYDDCHLADGVTNCEGIVWPGAANITAGKVLTLGDDEKVFRTEVIVGGVAQLHLEASSGESQPISIAVVGFSGTNVVSAELMKHVEIPINDQVHWRVELDAASPMATADTTMNPGAGPTTNALVWARKPTTMVPDPTGYTGCLAFQQWNGVAWETNYFVPKSDTDCDGEPPDCNPYWYNAPVSSSRCVTDSQVVNNVCSVGSLTCRSETSEIKCAEQQPPSGPLMCVGKEICNACGDSADLVTCMKSQISTNVGMTTAAIPIARCPFQGTQDTACINSTTQGWDAKFFIPGGACAPATSGEIAVIRPVGTPLSAGAAVLPVGTGAGQVSVHASPITNTTTGCQIAFTFTGGGVAPGPIPVVLRVAYGPTREILVPIVLDFQAPPGGICQTSTTPAACTVLGPWPEVGSNNADSMFSCTVP